MKIAFILGEFPNLSEIFILNQITGLIEMGNEVKILSTTRPKEKMYHDLIDKFKLMRLVTYFPAIPRNYLLRILKGKALFFLNFFKDPKRILGSINPFKLDKDIISLKVLFYVIPFLGKEFDVIHTHFGNNGIIGVYLKKGGVGGKLVTTFYGYDLSKFLINNGNKVYKNLFIYGDLFLPICKYFKDKLLLLSCPESKINVHPVGVDPEKYKYKKGVITGKVVEIITVGRLVEKKGYLYALSSVSELAKRENNFFYTIIGDGPQYDMLLEKVSELGLSAKVRFVGSVKQKELIEYYQTSDIFLLPSVKAKDGDEEGTPTVLLEAQAIGLPVVSSFHSGIPEIVIHGESGFLTKERDVNALSNYLELLVTDHVLRKKLGKNGRKNIEENFKIRKLNNKLVGYYNKLLNTKKT